MTGGYDERARILLIAPTALDYHGQPIKERRLYLPALTLPYLAALAPPEAAIRLIYETVEEIPFDEPWDAVGVTGMGSGIVRGWQIADRFRARGVPVIFGGIAASLGEPEWTLAHADSLVVGDAEESWPRALKDLFAGKLQRLYRSEKFVDHADMPVPRYDLMNRSRMGKWTPVQATRGCPHACEFCSVCAFHRGRQLCRRIDEVVRDVRAAKRQASRYIAFVDDNMAGDPQWAAALWEALVPEKIVWMSQCTLELADSPELVRLAHRSGCRLLSIGIESVNEESLQNANKVWNRPRKYTQAISTLRRHGIEVSTEMIVGFDGDDQRAFSRTAEFIENEKIAIPRVHILTPVPGTPLFEKMRAAQRIVDMDFAHYTGSKVVFTPSRMSAEVLQSEYWRLYERLFAWRAIARRLIPGPTRLDPFMRAVVWGSNLRYRRHVQARISPGIL